MTDASATDLACDLTDLADVPLGDVADTLTGEDAAQETLRRVAPADGTRLLVAASFNSAI